MYQRHVSASLQALLVRSVITEENGEHEVAEFHTWTSLGSAVNKVIDQSRFLSYLFFLLFLSISSMGTPLHPRLSFFVLMIMLVVNQLSSCRFIHSRASEASGKTVKTDFSPHFSWKFKEMVRDKSSKDESGTIYRASRRIIPAGPNPLHN
ncbi:hypothetical protein SADUNF_Sadunf02G0181600 [Salix dunnii]|uniref:Uncharacterized protein n=1 Tax=Salix dunnii TaxID=1413687 RepID=A0A835N8N4_9ROSI|nr:hypothetical protein SADUNF_Sadunf02G0181600 [Salix dunnii]